MSSDADGLYAFQELSPGGYFLDASAPGLLPGTARAGEPVFVAVGQDLRDVDIELQPGGAQLTGTVLDATGGPIAAAHVRALRLMPPRVSLEAQTDDEGRFSFPLRPGFIQLVAQADGYARASLRATAPSDVELRLVPGAIVEGSVVRAGTDTPVGAVEVRALSARTPQPSLAPGAVTTPDGHFRIQGLEPGSYALTAVGDRTRGRLAQPLDLGLAQHRSDLVIEVDPAVEVEGHVHIESTGQPCQQGTVALGSPSPLEPPPSKDELTRVTGGATLARATGPGVSAHVRADGSVYFPGVPPGIYYARVSCRGHRQRSGPRVLKIGSDPVRDVSWTVAPAASAEVRVVDGRGEPVPGVDVVLELPSHGPRIVSPYRTDDEGRATLESLSPGEYLLHPPSGYEGVPAVPFRVDESDDTGVQLTLRLPGRAFVTVRVRDEAEQPVDGLWVKAERSAAAAASAAAERSLAARALGGGTYRVGPLTDGRYDLALYDGVNPAMEGGHVPGTRVRVVGGRDVETEVRWPRGGAIEGVVLGPEGEVQPDVWVTALPDTPTRSVAAVRASVAAQAQPRRALSDGQGRFSMTGLAPEATFRVRASEPQGSAVVVTGVRPGDDVEIRLPKTASLSGVVVDAAQQPVTRFEVQAFHTELGARRSRFFADSQGRFTLTDVAPGAVQLAAVAAGGRASVALHLAPGEHEKAVRLNLAPFDPGLRDSEDAVE